MSLRYAPLSMRSILLALVFILIGALFTNTTYAQIGDSLIPEQAPTFTLTPPFPESGEEVTISLDVSSFDAVGADISWFINGVEEISLKNKRSFSLTTPERPETLLVRALIQERNGIREASTVISATDVDLVLEANTIVPVFYQGKALPSAGSIARIVAMPHFDIDPATLFYTWRVDNEVQLGGTLQGQQFVEIPLTNGTEKIVTVIIESAEGVLLARKSIAVDAFEPELHFYEVNPLRGTLPVALGGAFKMLAAEVGVAAMPFYMDTNTDDTNIAQHEWRIGRSVITNPSADPFFIALRKTGSGEARLSFSSRNLTDFIQRVSGDIRVIFE